MFKTREVAELVANKLTTIINDYKSEDSNLAVKEDAAKGVLRAILSGFVQNFETENTDENRHLGEGFYERLYTGALKSAQLQLRNLCTQLTQKVTTGIVFRETETRSSPLIEKLRELSYEIDTKLATVQAKQECKVLYAQIDSQQKFFQQRREHLGKEIQSLQQFQETAEKQLVTLHQSLTLLSGVWEKLPAEAKEILSKIQGINIKMDKEGQVEELNLKLKEGYETYESAPVCRYSSIFKPNKDLIETESLEGAQSIFWYTMSQRRAASALRLYRYFMKLQDIPLRKEYSKNRRDYQEERRSLESLKINIKDIIGACIFYLFMETEKNWLQILQDPHNPAIVLRKLANDHSLKMLSTKLNSIVRDEKEAAVRTQIVPSSTAPDISGRGAKDRVQLPKINLIDLIDTPAEIRAEGKNQIQFSGKFSAMFFFYNGLFKKPEFKTYSYEKCYSSGKHNYSELHELYKVDLKK